MPAHVTVLFPFIPRTAIDEAVREAVQAIAARTGPFDYTLAEIRWFGAEVVYLAPDPDRVFLELTAAVWGAFPDHPPYEGAHDDPIPHVTIGHTGSGDLGLAVEAIAPSPPIEATADRMDLIELVGDRWRTAESFALGVSP